VLAYGLHTETHHAVKEYEAVERAYKKL